jgi:hypothetical protein
LPPLAGGRGRKHCSGATFTRMPKLCSAWS